MIFAWTVLGKGSVSSPLVLGWTSVTTLMGLDCFTGWAKLVEIHPSRLVWCKRESAWRRRVCCFSASPVPVFNQSINLIISFMNFFRNAGRSILILGTCWILRSSYRLEKFLELRPPIKSLCWLLSRGNSFLCLHWISALVPMRYTSVHFLPETLGHTGKC